MLEKHVRHLAPSFAWVRKRSSRRQHVLERRSMLPDRPRNICAVLFRSTTSFRCSLAADPGRRYNSNSNGTKDHPNAKKTLRISTDF